MVEIQDFHHLDLSYLREGMFFEVAESPTVKGMFFEVKQDYSDSQVTKNCATSGEKPVGRRSFPAPQRLLATCEYWQPVNRDHVICKFI